MTQTAPLLTTPDGILQGLADLEAEFTDALTQHRFWEILPAAGQAPIAIYDAEKNLRYGYGYAELLGELETLCKTNPFLDVIDAQGNWLGTLDTATWLLWNHRLCPDRMTRNQAIEALENATAAGLGGWRLPRIEELRAFATRDGNPHRMGEKFLLKNVNGRKFPYWLTTRGRVDVDEGCWEHDISSVGHLFAVHDRFKQVHDRQGLYQIAILLLERQWKLRTPNGKVSFPVSQKEPGDAWGSLTATQLMALLAERGEVLRADGRVYAFAPHPAFPLLAEIDYRPSRLPRLEKKDLTDPERGLWELHGAPQDELRRWKLVARDPARDLKSYPVAIDFGTASTVVAVQTDKQKALLRIGARDYYAPVEPVHFENPTVVECLDFSAFWQAWTRTAYRPAHDWDWMRVGHEALASWRDNPGDPCVLASILPKLKQWALRGANAPQLRLTDRAQGLEIEIPPLTDRRPVRGEPLQVSSQDPFDPIEFYAWQLGMAINWRGRGLFLEYYLTFPIKYQRAEKDKILASFARGLQRSLPQTLIDQGKALTEFQVKEVASEPAAYAAAALPHLGLAPTEAGLAYAVFDFGGGTADFDYGLWRLPTPEEEDEGYDEVFEHIASAGDPFLGGENLLEHLAYRVFCANLDLLRQHRIHFTRPLDAQPFPGDEHLVQPTQSAQTNTVLLMSRLRAFWESEDGRIEPQLRLDLLDANGNKQQLALQTDGEALETFLRQRISQGVEIFLGELASAFQEYDVPEFHVLLAGNASRSRHVKALFSPEGEAWPQLLERIWSQGPSPKIIVHTPLPMDTDQPYAPTAKTGVALGLLRLAPGNGVRLIDHVRTPHGHEAPFRYFVGRMRRGVFQPVLSHGSAYGQWHDAGPIADGVFNLRFTLSLRARGEMKEGDPELHLYRQHLPEAPPGARLWLRPIEPGIIELALGFANTPPDAHTPPLRLDLDLLVPR